GLSIACDSSSSMTSAVRCWTVSRSSVVSCDADSRWSVCSASSSPCCTAWMTADESEKQMMRAIDVSSSFTCASTIYNVVGVHVVTGIGRFITKLLLSGLVGSKKQPALHQNLNRTWERLHRYTVCVGRDHLAVSRNRKRGRTGHVDVARTVHGHLLKI